MTPAYDTGGHLPPAVSLVRNTTGHPITTTARPPARLAQPAPDPLAAENQHLRAQLAQAADALLAVGHIALLLQPVLDRPQPGHRPEWTPWQGLAVPARTAYNLGILLAREVRGGPADRRPR